MTEVLDFDANDPLWQEVGEILDRRTNTSRCLDCGKEVLGKPRVRRHADIDLVCAWKEWRCAACGWETRSLFYWRRTDAGAPRRWKILAQQANLKELLLELKRSPFWRAALAPCRLLAQHAADGKIYVTVDDVLGFLEDIVTGNVYLEDDSELWPVWADTDE